MAPPTPLTPITFDDLLTSKRFAGQPDVASYFWWLITTGSGEPPWARWRRALMILIAPYEAQYEEPNDVQHELYLEGVVWYPPDIDPVIVTNDVIAWAPGSRKGDERQFLTDVVGAHRSGNSRLFIDLGGLPDFEYGQDYSATRWWSGDKLRVIRLENFDGEDLIDQANRNWVRENLADQVAFDDDGSFIVPADRPLLPGVVDALAALSDYALLDEQGYSQLEMEQEQEDWRHYGRREFQNALEAWMGRYLASLVDGDDDDEEESTPRLTEDQINDAVSEKVDEVWHNVRQHSHNSLYESSEHSRGFDIQEAMETLDRIVKPNDELAIAPVLLQLQLPVETGQYTPKCAYCGRVLHQSSDLAEWVDATDSYTCPNPDRGGGRHLAEAHSMMLQGI